MEIRGGSFRDRCLTLEDLVALLSRHRRTPRTVLAPHQQALLVDDLLATDESIPREFREVAGAADWLILFSRRLKQAWELTAAAPTGLDASVPVFSAAVAKTRFPSLRQGSPFVQGGLVAFDRYMDRLKDLKVYDEAGTFVEVARDLGGREIPLDRLFPARHRLVVEGFYLGSLIERQVFEKLFESWDEVIWLLDIPSTASAEEFGGGVYACSPNSENGRGYPTDLAWLAARGFVFEGTESGVVDMRLPHKRHLETPTQVEFVDQRRGDGGTFPTSPMDEARLLMGIAVLAYREAPAHKPRPRITIAFPSDRAIAPLLAALADDAGIPLVTHAKTSLIHVGAVRALADLLQLRTQDFARDAVVAAVRSLRCGIRIDDDGGEARYASASDFDDVSRCAHVIQGADEWTKRLADYEKSCREAVADCVDPEDAALARAQQRLESAQRVSSGWKVLRHRLMWGDAQALSVENFLECVKQLAVMSASDHRLTKWLDNNDPDFIAGAAFAWRADRLIVETMDAYARCRPYLTSSTRSFEEHVATFRSMLAASEVPIRPDAVSGIELVGLRDLRGLSTDVLLVGGLVERDFPAAPEPIAPFSEVDAARVGMRTRVSMIRESEHLLVHALHAAPRVVFSCSARDASGAPALVTRAYDELRSFLVREAASPELIVKERIADMNAAEWIPGVACSALGRMLGARSTAAPGPTEIGRRSGLIARVNNIGHLGAGALRRAHAARSRREGPPTAFDGMVEGGAVPWIADLLTGVTPISASSLDAYVRCPLAWYYERILGVQAPQSMSRDLSPMERGSLLHKILERFENLIASRGGSAAPNSDERHAILLALAEEELDRLPSEGLLSEVQRSSLLLGLDDPNSEAKGLLASYLVVEAGRPRTKAASLCEVTFGQPASVGTSLSRDPVRISATSSDTYGRQIVTLALRGAIDRVDLVDGDLVIIDYKVKASGMRSEVRKGLCFQLPLYGRVMRDLRARLEAEHPEHAWGESQIRVASYYFLDPRSLKVLLECTFGEENAAAKIRKSPPAASGLGEGGMLALENRYITRAADVLVSISRGRFHPNGGDPAICASCPFNAVCVGAKTRERFQGMGVADGLFEQESDPPMWGEPESDDSPTDDVGEEP